MEINEKDWCKIIQNTLFPRTLLRCKCGEDMRYDKIGDNYFCFDCGRIKEIHTN